MYKLEVRRRNTKLFPFLTVAQYFLKKNRSARRNRKLADFCYRRRKSAAYHFYGDSSMLIHRSAEMRLVVAAILKRPACNDALFSTSVSLHSVMATAKPPASCDVASDVFS
jgi:hypothetical protein